MLRTQADWHATTLRPVTFKMLQQPACSCAEILKHTAVSAEAQCVPPMWHRPIAIHLRQLWAYRGHAWETLLNDITFVWSAITAESCTHQD